MRLCRKVKCVPVMRPSRLTSPTVAKEAFIYFILTFITAACIVIAVDSFPEENNTVGIVTCSICLLSSGCSVAFLFMPFPEQPPVIGPPFFMPPSFVPTPVIDLVVD